MTHEGFIGSIGTSALLVSSAVAILLIVGTIVAFEGFPGPSVDDSAPSFPIQGLGAPAQRAPVFERPAVEADAAATPAAAVTVPSAPALNVDGEPAPLAPAEPVPPPAAPTGNGSETGGSGSGGSVDDGSSSGPLGETLDQATGSLETTVERLLPATEPVFDALDRLTP